MHEPRALPVRRQEPVTAALLMLASAAFIAGSTLFAKAVRTDALGPALPAIQVVQARFLFGLLALVIVAAIFRPTLTRPHYGLHLARVSAGMSGMVLLFTAVAFIPLSDATAITFLNPVFAMVLAIPFLKERVGLWRWLSAAVALAGALVLTRPSPATFEPAALIALTAAVALGCDALFMKRLSALERPFQILIVSNALGLLLASVAALAFLISPTPAQWAALAGVGLLMLAAQTLGVNALARADASFAIPFVYATLVFAALYDALAFSVVPDVVSIVGSAMIVTGAILLAWRGRG
jgi:drug/metabolite transporter (DMT)-like permease